MNYRINIHSKTGVVEESAAAGTNLRQFLQQNHYELDSPCNGKGTCGKCQVRLSGVNLPKPTLPEQAVFNPAALATGYRLACQITINQALQVHLEKAQLPAQVMTEGKMRRFPLAPAVTKRLITLPPATLDDQRPDSERLSDALALDRELNKLDLLRQLPEVCHQNNSPITLSFYRGDLLGMAVGDTTASLYGIAVDIGTTTIAAYLVDLSTGERLATYSCLNQQKKYGADVIARIQHTVEQPAGLAELHRTIIDGINLAAAELTARAGLASPAIDAITLVGNTTMIHFLLKLSAQNIAASPFIPVTTQPLAVKAADLGFKLNPHAVAVIIPAVAAYIGADTVAAVLASGMDEQNEISLLIDFGTNGEIVLGNRDTMLACSAAAGPAFEGAKIRHGVGGIQGAIDSFSVAPQVSYTTIGAAKPLGICGSGLIDLVATLYQSGIIDATGRLETDPDLLKSLPPELVDRLTPIDGMATFRVATATETANGQAIVLTQKDIRELQNAKAAIAAGIRVLTRRAGLRLDQIHQVYLAGGFGAYINTASALALGLIPPELDGKIISIGNAAGAGAMAILLSEQALTLAETIKGRIKYVELAACREFNDFFVDAMFFPE
jgi:uncharacterized 2Fe-2S/4Fe-4S cluster protein (DUF4445 family)